MKYKKWLIVLLVFPFCGFFLGVPAPVNANGASFYDLNSADSNAYQMNGSFGIPAPTAVSWTAYTGAQLTNARHQDELRNSWAAPANNTYYLLYRFKINENLSDITKIDFDWIGYDTQPVGGKCLTRLIWNKNTPSWETLDSD